jgi:predicted transcriptional regulator
MDESIQIKHNLISRIKDSNDIDFLKALQTLFENSEKSFFELSEQQKNSIKKGKQDIKEGRFKKNHEVISEMEEWLKKK